MKRLCETCGKTLSRRAVVFVDHGSTLELIRDERGRVRVVTTGKAWDGKAPDMPIATLLNAVLTVCTDKCFAHGGGDA